jgi:hypothetical protein
MLKLVREWVIGNCLNQDLRINRIKTEHKDPRFLEEVGDLKKGI